MHGIRIFDVIQTLQQGEQCHIVLNRIPGRTLEEICKDDGRISKEEFYNWMEQLVNHLEHLHKCRPVKIYQFLTPYTVIIGNDEKVYLLDLEHESNREIVRRHFDKRVQYAFFPEESMGKRRPGVSHDLYAAGKTMQYVLAKCQITPELGRMEERRLCRMIKKVLDTSSRRSLHSAREWKVLLIHCKGKNKKQQFKQNEEKNIHPGRKFLAVSAVIIVVAAGIQVMFSRASASAAGETAENSFYYENAEEQQVSKEQDIAKSQEAEKRKEAELNQKLGLLYFQKLEDYAASIPCFAKAKEYEERAESYEVLAKYRCGTYGIAEDEAEDAIRKLMEMPETFTALEKAEGMLDLIRSYEQMENMDGELELIEECLGNQSEWRAADINGIVQKELYERGAAIYAFNKDWENAISMQEVLIEQAEAGKEYDSVCLELGNLYFQNRQFEEGEQVSLEGIEKCINRTAAAVNYTKHVCENSANSVKQKEKKLTAMIGNVPEISSDEEFLKLQQENGFAVKEGKVCFE